MVVEGGKFGTGKFIYLNFNCTQQAILYNWANSCNWPNYSTQHYTKQFTFKSKNKKRKYTEKEFTQDK